MQKYSEVLGLPVISLDNGKKVGNVKNIIFCPKKKKFLLFCWSAKALNSVKKLFIPMI